MCFFFPLSKEKGEMEEAIFHVCLCVYMYVCMYVCVCVFDLRLCCGLLIY